MQTRAALLYSQPGKWEVTDIELDEPKQHEVLVRIMAAGLCHSDDVPRLVNLYRSGQLKLSELITREYTLDEINQGYEDMHAGRNIRGVIRMDR